MTNEEAIRWLDMIKKYYIHGGDEAYDKKRMKAVDKAIQALEQQPTHGSTYGGVSWGGTYRDATEEERKSVKDYVESISRPTGVRFDTQPTDAKETIIKSALKYLVKMQIEQGSVGFAVDNDHDHDCCWDDVLAWIEAQPCENAVSREAVIKTIKEMFNANPSYTHTCDVVDRQDLIDSIDELPSVTPKYTDEEIDKAQAVEQAYVDKMVELAVEESRREWLNSFDTSSATKCFTAVNVLKERLENEET